MKFMYAESDPEFVRWTSNLFRSFIESGEMELSDEPDAILTTSTALRVHPEILDSKIPLILVHNEAWTNYWPPCEPDAFKAILGCCPVPFTTDKFVTFPYHVVHFNDRYKDLLQKRKMLLQKPKSKFCCFLTSNDFVGAPNMVLKRKQLFEKLDSLLPVDSGGKVENNIGYCVPAEDTIDWISDYKFMICLENTKDNPGYITEKPFQPWFAGTVPIYDGSIAYRLNQDAFVNASLPILDIIDQIMILDNDDEMYEAMRANDIAKNLENEFSLETFEKEFREKVLE